MRLIGKRSLSGLVKLILDVCYYGGFAGIALSPKLAKMFIGLRFYGSSTYLYSTVLSVFIVTGTCVLYILHELRKVFKSITNHEPFIIANVKSLFRMGIASFLAGIFFIVKLAILNSLLTYVVIFIFIIAGCFSLVLSEVFKEAVRVKDENDFTI